MAELALSPLGRGRKRAGSSPPSPESDLAPMRFMAMLRVPWASGESAPSDMPGVIEALADLGDGFHLVDGDRGLADDSKASRSRMAMGGRFSMRLGIALEGLVGFRGHGRLQHVDEAGLPGMGLAAAAEAVEAADGQRRVILAPGAPVQLQHPALDAHHADAGDARRHVGEIFRHHGAREAERLEEAAAAIAGDHGDAHLGHDLQQALVEGLAIALQAVLQACGSRTGRGDGGRRCWPRPHRR